MVSKIGSKSQEELFETFFCSNEECVPFVIVSNNSGVLPKPLFWLSEKKIKSVSFGLTPISGARGAVLNIPLIIIRDEKLLE